MSTLLSLPCSLSECDAFLSRPTKGVRESLSRLDGDIIVIGAGGKMGPTLAIMAAQVLKELGGHRKVKAVSRFSNAASRELLESHGVETIPCDLLDRGAVSKLPECKNVIFMAGQKFGTSEGADLTWAMNTLVPSYVAEHYALSRIVAFSTGCVYSFSQVALGGSREGDPIEPLGDYANSCIGRERIFEYASRVRKTPVCIYRLNYAIDFRYGVLLDIGQKVYSGEPVDVTSGHVNVIWQGDANARALQCLEHAASPATILNVTGPETVSIRELAHHFGKLFNKPVTIVGEEALTGWVSNAGKSFSLFGYPEVSLDQMVEWTAAWLQQGGSTLGKPTHFEARDGKF